MKISCYNQLSCCLFSFLQFKKHSEKWVGLVSAFSHCKLQGGARIHLRACSCSYGDLKITAAIISYQLRKSIFSVYKYLHLIAQSQLNLCISVLSETECK